MKFKELLYKIYELSTRPKNSISDRNFLELIKKIYSEMIIRKNE
jgi:hypothetical protein